MFNILSNFINPKPLPNGVRTTYKVPPKQNLFEIALQFDCNPWKLKEINNLDNTIIEQGQNLEVFLPSSNSTSHYSYIDRQNLLTINQTIPVIYYAAGYNVKGILQIQYDFLLFMPIHKKLDSEIKNKGDNFEFLAYFREIHKIQYNPMTKIIQIYLWGVNHTMVPVVDGNFFESIMIEIKMNPKKTKQIKPFLKKLCHLGNEASKLKTIEGMTFLFYLLQYEHEYVVEDSLNPLIKSMKFKIKPIECQSKALNYSEVQIDMSEGFIQTKPQSKQQSLKQQMYQPKLSDISRILTDENCMQLSSSLPQYLQTKDWYLIYSINQHGTSEFEFLRRSEQIGPHLIVVKDENKKVFGAFATSSWKLSKSEFFGSGESFLFRFEDSQLKLFRATQKNSYFQMADGTGYSLGAEDKYGLFINKDISRGSSYPCETYDNEQLSSSPDFQIYELELWAMDDEQLAQLKWLEQKRSLFQ